MELEILRQEPETPSHATPLLFVHGYWHGAWCWSENFLPYFAQQGFTAYAVSLRGHGASEGREHLRWISVADYVDDVEQVIRTLGTAPVLVGHSLGGLVVCKYLERRDAPAAVLMSSVPVRGLLGFTLRAVRHHPWVFAKAILTLTPMHAVSTPQLARETFYSAGIAEESLTRYHAQIRNDSFRAYLDMMLFNLPRPALVKTPMLVLGAKDDAMFTVDEARATARAYGTEADILPGVAHNMMLEPGWQAVADRIVSWLKESGI